MSVPTIGKGAKHRRRTAAALVAVALACGCGGFASAKQAGDAETGASPFDWSRKPGHATIEGRLAVRTPDGRLAAKGGADVVLLPYATFTRLYLERSAKALAARKPADGVDSPPLDPALEPYVRRERAGGDGSFRFANLPQGTWIVRGRLSVGFARTVYTNVPTAMDVGGQRVTGDELRRAIVYDYSFAWFDSQPLTVRGSARREAVFHLVARIDRTNPHR